MTIETDKITEALKQAQEAVEQAGIAEDLRGAAFSAAFGLLTGSNEPPIAHEQQDSASSKETADDGSMLGRVAAKLGVSADVLSYFYEEGGGDLRLVIRRTMLPNPRSRAAAMRDVAQLVMAGRQLAEVDEWTSYERLRSECEELGVLDKGNFATEIQTLDIRYQGAHRSRSARLTRHGLDRAIALIREMIERMEP
jgi:hypothetical protein